MKRIRLTSEQLNSHGFWLKTDGGDLELFKNNPIMLYMHERGNVVGKWVDLQVEQDGTITAEPSFDEATELSTRLKKQYEFGSINMCSVSADVIETSDDPALIKPGQRYPTITKWRLNEVSLCDIGSNRDAIKLCRNGQTINLSDGEQTLLPLLNNNPVKKTIEMDIKTIAVQLGLPDTATQADIDAKLAALKAAEAENATLKADKEALALAAITAAVDAAVGERKINEADKEQFVALGKKLGMDELKNMLAKISPAVKLSDTLDRSAGQQGGKTGYKKLSEVPAEEIEDMRTKNLTLYKKLYKAEYGIEAEID